MGDDTNLETMILAYLDGRLSQPEVDRLGQKLIQSESARKVFWAIARTHAGIEVRIQEQYGGQAFARRCNELAPLLGELLEYEQRVASMSEPRPLPEHLQPLDADAHEPDELPPSDQDLEPIPDRRPKKVLEFGPLRVVRRPGSQRRSARHLRNLAYAASLAALIGVTALFMQRLAPMDPDPHPAPVATLIDATAAQWLDEQGQPMTLDPDDTLTPGSLTLATGFAELRMNNQTRVILDGPVAFTLQENEQIHLDTGRVVAHLGPPADSFTISTPTSRITDLGTEFGVDVQDNGSTDVAVFDGAARVTQADDSPSQAADPLVLRAGWHAHVDAQGSLPDQITRLSTESIVFIREMIPAERLHDGIIATTGQVQQLTLDGDEPRALAELTHPEQTFIHREERRVLDEDLPVVVASDGFADEFDQQEHVVPAGTEVTSYLLQFAPALEEDDEPVPSSGAIRFSGQIVGVIGNTERLKQTDQLFGTSLLNYTDLEETARGLESTDIQNEPDLVRVTHNGRLFHFNFRASTGIDQARVLVVEQSP